MKHPELNVSAARSTPLLRAAAGASGLLLRQCFDADTGTYTYLLADPASGEGVLIDPVFSQHGRDLALIRELGIALVATLDTHVHADHVSGAWLLQRATGCAIGLAERAGAENVTLPLVEGDRVRFGGRQLAVLATPGHTDSCLTFVLDDQSAAFTGDALLIRGCGRCDFQQGDARTLYSSITSRIFPLPEACLLYPGHDYSGRTVSSVAEEMAFNARLRRQRQRTGLRGLPGEHEAAPSGPDRRGPARQSALREAAAGERPRRRQLGAGAAQLCRPAGAGARLGGGVHRHALTLVDVRGAEEFDGPDGHLTGSLLIPLPELQERLAEIPLERPVVLLCHSGCRSALATQLLLKAGRDKVANLRGGLRAWEVEGLALEGADRGAG